MSSKHHSKIKSAVLIASVAILAMVFGILLDNEVIPEKSSPLTMEEAKPKKEVQARHSKEIKELETETKAAMERAESLTKRADQLISKSDISNPITPNQDTPDNKSRAERLAGLRDRLDALRK